MKKYKWYGLFGIVLLLLCLIFVWLSYKQPQIEKETAKDIKEIAELPQEALQEKILQEPVQEETQELVQEEVQELVQEEVQEPVQEEVQEPVQEEVQMTAQEITQEVMQKVTQEIVQVNRENMELLETDNYISPINFDALHLESKDIRAWLSIKGLEIEAPVMAHSTDNNYYHRRDVKGEQSISGSFYMENYNKYNFTDPVTVIYGHNMKKGMFGSLQESYSNQDFFETNNMFTVYTPDAQYDYQIFAAVPYSNRHILYYNDFFSFPVLEKFVKEIYNTRSLTAVIDESIKIEENDRLCILSTCLDKDNTKRYLVIGVWKNTDKKS